MSEAADFLHEYVLELPSQVWREQPSGLFIPQLAPKYLFRGECGDHQTTVAGLHRRRSYCLRDGRRLSSADLDVVTELLPNLAQRFSDNDYALDEHSAIGLLQHYGLPTWLIDFTCNAGHAITFAGAHNAKIGRICVMPTTSLPRFPNVVDLMNHRWSERPRRQDAFGIIMPSGYRDLKARDVRDALRLKWYEFPLLGEERSFLRMQHAELIRLDNDPSAGFIRLHITEYVEARGKLSPLLTDWLLERNPIAPWCAEVKQFDGNGVVINQHPPSVMGRFDLAAEKNWSRRYWSSAYQDSSWDRMKGWAYPSVGQKLT